MYNYVQKRTTKSPVTTSLPRIFSGIWLQTQAVKSASLSFQLHQQHPEPRKLFKLGCVCVFPVRVSGRVSSSALHENPREGDLRLKAWKGDARRFLYTLKTSKIFNMRLYLYKAKLQNHSKAFLINCCQSRDLQRQ